MSPPSTSARKPVFDTVRKILSRTLRQPEVDAIDAALDQTCGSSVASPMRDARHGSDDTSAQPLPVHIGPAGIALIKRFEGCAKVRPDGAVEAYPDPATGGDPWTIGWGATGACHVHGGRIGSGTIWTRAQCDARLADDLVRYAADVAEALGSSPRTQAQFDAMVSFHYNTGAVSRATLTRRHIGGDEAGAASEFARWNRAGGRVLRGLVRRRAEEARMYRGK